MPSQVPEAKRAIEKMEQGLADVLQEWRDAKNSSDYKKGKKGAKEKVKALGKKYWNLRKVIEVLKTADIKHDSTSGEAANANKLTTPPTIKVDLTLLAIRDEVMAQILAHEAVHLLSKSPLNSIDEEIRCRKKEVEVWELLKGDENHPLDYICNNEQKLMAKSEAKIRAWLRTKYPGVPEKELVPKKKPKKRKKTRRRGRVKAPKSGKRRFQEFNDLFSSFFRELTSLVFIGNQTDDEYRFDATWPAGYDMQESEGCDEVFQGLVGVGPIGAERGLPATLSVNESPDVLHGGEWSSYEVMAEQDRDIIMDFNSEVFETNPVTLMNEPCQVAGQPGQCVELEYDINWPELKKDDQWKTRIRERSVYTQQDEYIFKLSFWCEAAEWNEHIADFERVISSFRIR